MRGLCYHPRLKGSGHNSRSHRPLRKVFFLIFTVSGFAGLIYESIWTHYLKLFLGHAAYAQTLVLAIFMAGLGAGSWLCSRYSARWSNLLKGYAVTEGIIGLLAVVFHPVFDGFVNVAYSIVIPELGSTAAATAFKWGGGALLILPQSVLLGMTFPLMSAGMIRRFPLRPGETIALLYFTNSIGGAVGVLASGFWLIKLVGLPGTIGLAGIINIALAVLVWRFAGDEPETRKPAPIAASPGEHSADDAMHRLLLAASLLTGFASLIYEIGWIRMLSLVLSSSTHAFELMLSAFIFGLAFGGLWIRRRIDGIIDPLRYLGYVQFFMGLLALSTLLVYSHTFDVMKWMLDMLPRTETGYSWFNLGSHGIALAVMLPATFCAGMTLPLVTYTLLRGGWGEGSIGAVYAANTVGAITGVFAAVHLGMPLLGLKGLIAFGSAVDMGLGVALLWWGWKRDGWRLPALGTALGVSAVAATLIWVQLDPHKMASGVFRLGTLLSPVDVDVVDHRDGKTATVHLTQQQDLLSIRTNGKIDASVNVTGGGKVASDESTMVLSGTLGLLLNPQAKRVANIGFGSGVSTHVVLTHPSVEQVDTVEIEPAMVALARRFRVRNELAYSDPRSHIHFEDAKTFFLTHNEKYDLIISEPSNPWVSGVAGLFSVEFYRLVRHQLREGGMLVQWLQLYEVDFILVASVLKALGSHFDHYAIFAANDGDILIVARNGAPLPPIDGSLFQVPRFAGELARVGINQTADVEVRHIATKELLAPLLARIPIAANSDYYPVLDQNAARTRFLQLNAGDLIALAAVPVPALELLGVRLAVTDTTSITASEYYRASQLYRAATVLRDASTAVPRRAAASCAEPAVRGDKIDGMLNVGMAVVPYLRPEELVPIWRWIETQPCGSQLNAVENDWLALLKMIGNRNSKEMTKLAEHLLQGGGLTPQRTRYLVMVAMLGHIAQRNKPAARELWSRYRGEIAPDAQSQMLFFILAAHSIAP
ncbi:MAG TPA: hypothetical protein VKF40_23770 [Burkholderiales bacterium]|nr:hypothetical protein [Burkholderiales bacterium]